MSKMKKIWSLLLALTMGISMVACGGGGSTDDGTSSGGTTSEAPGSSDSGSGSGNVSSNPYKLKVYSFSGGYGEAWINALTERYKKERAGDTIVIDGKTYAIDACGQQHLVKMRLFEIEQLLPTYFVRINKSAIANEKQIAKFKATFAGAVDVIFKCGHTDYVSRRCFSEIKRRYQL